MISTLLYVVVIPVAIGVCKLLFEAEILYWLGFFSTLYHRPFDLDKNPDTHDWCLLYNPGNGEWDYVSLTFHFSLFRGKTGVLIHRYNTGYQWEPLSVQRVSFAKWKTMDKAHIDKNNLPQGLLNHISKSAEKGKVENY